MFLKTPIIKLLPIFLVLISLTIVSNNLRSEPEKKKVLILALKDAPLITTYIDKTKFNLDFDIKNLSIPGWSNGINEYPLVIFDFFQSAGGYLVYQDDEKNFLSYLAGGGSVFATHNHLGWGHFWNDSVYPYFGIEVVRNVPIFWYTDYQAKVNPLNRSHIIFHSPYDLSQLDIFNISLVGEVFNYPTTGSVLISYAHHLLVSYLVIKETGKTRCANIEAGYTLNFTDNEIKIFNNVISWLLKEIN